LIHETDFFDVDLHEADFSHSDLKGSNFQKANLVKANFTGARNYFINPLANQIAKARFSSPEALALLAAFDIVVEY
jgi:uncharacterized protein YjbI with pentapeptide repeats